MIFGGKWRGEFIADKILLHEKGDLSLRRSKGVVLFFRCEPIVLKYLKKYF